MICEDGYAHDDGHDCGHDGDEMSQHPDNDMSCIKPFSICRNRVLIIVGVCVHTR